ncbi:MBOAT family protein [Mucilaginibacter sp. UR6-1]|uniref:MBOAT family O-acyltransferase n=1 Tax=Mucilaginibacter sp. UR6-1 TaxID=1435643 RepID=UPI001E586C35|nr:MBOAT family O-acyltransferase [Mucilaginibacter sp. UR6-1]MCC8409604.1 MBOAT family protein [Mucilaginibacter sp. UR6-1]
MLFNSIQFVVFLVIVLVVYRLLNQKGRLYFLLAASYFFYACWSFSYLGLIFFTSSSCFLSGLLIEKSPDKRRKKLFLTLSIVVNFLILFIFKYFNFFVQAAQDVSFYFHYPYHFDFLDILLPVGISFYTFHSISYVIDVYRGEVQTEKNLFRFLLFVSFFPQLVAGPIARTKDLLPQLRHLDNYKYENFRRGFVLIFWGLFKKMVVADRLAIAVNHVYNHVDQASSVSLIIATIFFTYQIYCDFSGYSDIALGVSKLFGIDLMLNFRSPYFSKTVTEFWRRWHISLSTWFRDYLYIPLGGNKVSQGRWIFNTVFVFVISGLWHGAAYTFLIWGAIHGIMLVVERYVYGRSIRNIKPGVNLKNILRWAVTYVIVIIGWVFFRANNLSDSFVVFGKIFEFSNIATDVKSLFVPGGAESLIGLKFYDFVLAIVFVIMLVTISFAVRKTGVIDAVLNMSLVPRWVFYIGVTFLILWFGKFGVNEFVYFQF